MIPYHVGALLPAHQRYINRQFRAIARHFRNRRLDYDDVLCLAAFLDVCPVKTCARFVFHWDRWGVKAGNAVVRHYTDIARLDGLIHANRAAISADDGLAVLRAMQDGGWTRNPVPLIVSQALAELRHGGMSIGSISKLTGLTNEQVRHNIYGRRGRKDGSSDQIRANVALAV